MSLVSHERLTRHELSWLLAQEARGAAKALREEVVHLKGLSSEPEGVAPTLDALDDAIDMLTALNAGRTGGKARRGRIDIAALLYAIAPNARIAIEPGAGTEVFGDEAELGRMLSVLVTQSAAAAPAETEIRIRRQGEWIKISVDLGPDAAATGELERRWLSRMATRYGGFIELEGRTQTVFLQADGASDQRELSELKKELAQAQKLGEAYARELAAMLAGGELSSELPRSFDRDGSHAFEGMRALSVALERRLRALAEGVREDAANASTLADAGELAAALSRRAGTLQELALELAQIAECPLDEPARDTELGRALGDAVEASLPRASRLGVSLVLEPGVTANVRVQRGALGLLLGLLLTQALNATPRGATVRCGVLRLELGTAVRVQDGGPVVPEASRASLLSGSADPSSFGRPGGVALVAGATVARSLGARLELREGPTGTSETWIFF